MTLFSMKLSMPIRVLTLPPVALSNHFNRERFLSFLRAQQVPHIWPYFNFRYLKQRFKLIMFEGFDKDEGWS